MTTSYIFIGGWKKAGKAVVPTSVPTITIVDVTNPSIALVSAAAMSLVTPITSAYYYSYSGADNLPLAAYAETSDTTMDEQGLFIEPQSKIQTGDNYARLGVPVLASISADIAAQPASIWDRLTSALITSGSIGKLIVDYLDMQVSLIYSRVASATITVNSPVLSGGSIEIIPGDDYYYADGRSLDWSSNDWPNLTGAASVKFYAGFASSSPVTMSVVTAGTGSQTVRAELPKTLTSLLTGFVSDFSVVAVLSDGHVATLVKDAVARG
jgi:hypothetical protein